MLAKTRSVLLLLGAVVACSGGADPVAETSSSVSSTSVDPDSTALSLTFASQSACQAYLTTPIAGGTVAHWVQNGEERDDPCGPHDGTIRYMWATTREVTNSCVAFVGGGSRIVRDGDYRRAYAWATATSPRYGCFSTPYTTSQSVTEWGACDDWSTSATRIYRSHAGNTPIGNYVSYSACTPDNGYECTPILQAPGTFAETWQPDGWDVVPGTRIAPGNDQCKQASPATTTGAWDPPLPDVLSKPFSGASDAGADSATF